MNTKKPDSYTATTGPSATETYRSSLSWRPSHLRLLFFLLIVWVLEEGFSPPPPNHKKPFAVPTAANEAELMAIESTKGGDNDTPLDGKGGIA